jgi:hypothetical protein
MEDVITHYEQALAIARDISDRREEASHYWNLGLLHEDSDSAHAADLIQVCVDFERAIGHPDAEADAEWVLGLRTRAARDKRASGERG